MRGTQGTQEMGGGTSMALPRSRSIASSSLHTLFAAVCIFISYVLNCSGRTELQDLLWANPVGDCMASRRPVPDSPRATVVDEILPTQPFLGERSRGTYTIVEHLPEWRDRRQIFIALFLFEKNFELGSLISDSIQLVKARQNAGLDAILRQLMKSSSVDLSLSLSLSIPTPAFRTNLTRYAQFYILSFGLGSRRCDAAQPVQQICGNVDSRDDIEYG
ncbi:hypothetical protein C8R43DRAFT_954146 [Mycena crocata]|nr:hypothetical protein C8R43DRAFT_954146 [Mycena crocata]